MDAYVIKAGLNLHYRMRTEHSAYPYLFIVLCENGSFECDDTGYCATQKQTLQVQILHICYTTEAETRQKR